MVSLLSPENEGAETALAIEAEIAFKQMFRLNFFNETVL